MEKTNFKKTFNYQLASYSETKRNKWNNICPNCGRAEFSPYINVHTDEPVDERLCGKCNREHNCGYHMPPREWAARYGSMDKPHTTHQYTEAEVAEAVEYSKMKDCKSFVPQGRDEVMKHYTGLNYLGQVQSIAAMARYTPNSSEEQHPAVKAYFDRMATWCEESLTGDNTLVKYLYTIFPKERVDAALKLYHIGSTDNGHIIYWQIDEAGNVHTGKIMAYGTDGHRKKGRGAFNWVHTAKGEEMFPGQCLFGEHLLRDYSILSPIGLVESEKTAFILSILMPDVVWLATGGKQNFSLKMLAPLMNRDIYLLPDTDAMIEWSIKAREWSGMEFNFIIPEWYRTMCDDPRVRDMKWDIADILLRKLGKVDILEQ